MVALNDNSFNKMFRVDFETFINILDDISPHIKVANEVKALNLLDVQYHLFKTCCVSLMAFHGHLGSI